MDRFVQHEKPSEIKILDLAAGSGEATEVSLRRCMRVRLALVR